MKQFNPTTLSDFKRLGKTRLRGISPEAAYKKHNERAAADKPYLNPKTLGWEMRAVDCWEHDFAKLMLAAQAKLGVDIVFRFSAI